MTADGRIDGLDGAAPVRVASPDGPAGFAPELLAALVVPMMSSRELHRRVAAGEDVRAADIPTPIADAVDRELAGDLTVGRAALLRRDLEAALALLDRRRGVPGERFRDEFLVRWRESPPPPAPQRGAVRAIDVQITDAYDVRYTRRVTAHPAHAAHAMRLIRDAAVDCRWTIDDLRATQIEHTP